MSRRPYDSLTKEQQDDLCEFFIGINDDEKIGFADGVIEALKNGEATLIQPDDVREYWENLDQDAQEAFIPLEGSSDEPVRN